MTRAYIRIDPSMIDKKMAKGYSDGAIATYVAVLCAAESQSPRGRFRNALVLKGHLNARHHRHLAFLFDHDDLIDQPDGTIYVEGWDPWQEGNIVVAERMKQVRDRRKLSNTAAPDRSGLDITNDVTPEVTAPSELARVLSGEPLAVSRSGKHSRNALSSSTATSAGARDEPKEDADYAILAEGLSTLLGRILSADDLTEARAWIVDFPYLTAAQMLDRTAAFIEWRASQGLGQPRTARSCRGSLTRENGYQADTGNGRKAERKGFVALAEIVRGKAPASSDGGEAGLPPTLDQDPVWQRSQDVRNPDPQPLQLAEGEVF